MFCTNGRFLNPESISQLFDTHGARSGLPHPSPRLLHTTRRYLSLPA
jgi:hypothetical protein